MTSFWSWYVSVIAVVNIAGTAWLLLALAKGPKDGPADGEAMGHSFDDIEELNNPLPRWWLWVFVGGIVFAVLYLGVYPGLGSYLGVFEWSSSRQWDEETARAEARYGPIFAAYLIRPIPELVDDERALRIGGRLFAINCSPCHGSDARGGRGFPNLTDGDWLHGGDPQTIKTTIMNGRTGVMPPMGAAIGGEEGIAQLANYVLSLSGREHNAELAKLGEPKFQTICFVCHGPDGKGKREVGSANLTDDTWLHGGSEETIRETIRHGRTNIMPAHKELLGEERIHLLALYVYNLFREEREPAGRIPLEERQSNGGARS
jgi:cytochrome c oxidase cbb3-type subunit 3